MIEKIGHYSITNAGSIYDEEALTALELSAKTAKKVNDVIDAVNGFESSVPNMVDKEVDEILESGRFDDKLDEYVGQGSVAIAQNKQMYDYMTQLTADTFKLSEALFERGSWNDHDVPNNNVTNRARTKEAIYFPFDVTLKVANGFRLGGYLCDAFGNSETSIGWDTTPYTLSAGVKVKLIIARVNEDDTETCNVSAFVNQLTGQSAISENSTNLETEIRNVNADMFTLSRNLFKNGSLKGWEDGSFVASYPYRIATPDILSFPYKVVITPVNGFRFALSLFAEGQFMMDAGWQTHEYTLPAGQQFRIMIGRTTEDDTETADPVTFSASVLFTNYTVINAESGNTDALADFDFIFGSLSSGVVKGSHCRLVTRNILSFDHAVKLKYNANIRIAVHTYDAEGTFQRDLGWVTQTADYIIPKGTRFRLMVATLSYENEKPINERFVYETLLYKSIKIEHASNTNVDMFNNVREIARQEVNKGLKSFSDRDASARVIKGICHRGYVKTGTSVENSMESLVEAVKQGFKFVECDVRFSSDGIPFLYHDEYLNPNTTGFQGWPVSSGIKFSSLHSDSYLTNEYHLGYDDGGFLWSGSIPSFETWVKKCASLMVHPYIEIQDNITTEQAKTLFDIVKNAGMLDHVTWISFTLENLLKILDLDPSARIGYNVESVDEQTHIRLKTLRTGYNEVFVNINVDTISTHLQTVKTMGYPLECWTVNDKATMKTIDAYVTGITSDTYNASVVLLEDYQPEPEPVFTPTTGTAYIDGVRFTFPLGWTFGQLIASEYNVGLSVGDTVYDTVNGDDRLAVVKNDRNIVYQYDTEAIRQILSTDPIIPERRYTFELLED